MNDSKILPEVEFYKMIMLPDGDMSDYTFVREFGWQQDEFFIWISYSQLEDFIEYFVKTFGYCGLEYGGCTAILGVDYLVINMCELLGDEVNIESVFPKDKYKH